MNDLIKVTYNAGEPTVSARDLHEGLEIGTRFNVSKNGGIWFCRRKGLLLKNE